MYQNSDSVLLASESYDLRVRAALARDGVFAYIGEPEEVKALAGADARVLDYGGNFIYSGFLESLHDDIEKVAKARVIATIVDGNEVYKA